jgi:hypothetical protein
MTVEAAVEATVAAAEATVVEATDTKRVADEGI